MFGSNGPCSPGEYLPPYSNILEPIYFPSSRDIVHQQPQPLPMDSDPEYHSSAPPTPDVISGLMSLSGGPCPSEISSGSFGDLTSPEDCCHSTSPPSYSMDVSRVQATRSKLIKEGLKLTIQSRRMINGLDNARSEYNQPQPEELTREDEDRRRRRRERNKVAATKCRNKKKEKTGKLAQESESLEVNNNALKHEIHSLENEKNELLSILQGHLPHCGLQPTRTICDRSQRTMAMPQPTWSSVLS